VHLYSGNPNFPYASTTERHFPPFSLSLTVATLRRRENCFSLEIRFSILTLDAKNFQLKMSNDFDCCFPSLLSVKQLEIISPETLHSHSYPKGNPRGPILKSLAEEAGYGMS